jgi:hypothetical protein
MQSKSTPVRQLATVTGERLAAFANKVFSVSQSPHIDWYSVSCIPLRSLLRSNYPIFSSKSCEMKNGKREASRSETHPQEKRDKVSVALISHQRENLTYNVLSGRLRSISSLEHVLRHERESRSGPLHFYNLCVGGNCIGGAW